MTPAIGALVWLLWVVLARPGALGESWPGALVLLAALVVVPLGAEVAGCHRAIRAALFPSALALAVALLLPRGTWAALAAGPWTAATVALAADAFIRLVRKRFRPLAEVAILAGPVLLSVGGAWLLADRLGGRPLGFHPLIVLLTAAHFHYAGFVLPLVAGLALRRAPGTAPRLAAIGVVAGVPCMAAGITVTELGASPWIETAAVAFVAAAALLLAAVLAAIARDPTSPPRSRSLLTLAAASLAAAMLLAALYGGRFLLGHPLDVVWMWATHGTLNALGFAIPALAAFRGVEPPGRAWG